MRTYTKRKAICTGLAASAMFLGFLGVVAPATAAADPTCPAPGSPGYDPAAAGCGIANTPTNNWKLDCVGMVLPGSPGWDGHPVPERCR